MTRILSLPVETITHVGDYLPDKDLAHFAQGTRVFHQILSRSLLKRSLEDQPPPVVKIPALQWAIHHGHTSLVKTIVSQPRFSPFADETFGALYLAAELGQSDIIPVLITVGYAVQGSGTDSPLHLAAMNGHASAVTQLLDYGARIDHEDSQSRTALICAIYAPQTVWGKLITNGISAENELKLRRGIDAQVVDTIQILLDRGAQAQIQIGDPTGYTPLHHAVLGCLGTALDPRVGTGVLRLLVKAGASMSVRDRNDQSPIDFSTFRTGQGATSLTFFLEMGVCPNTKHMNGVSLLAGVVACHDEVLPVMQVLLDRGATTDDISLLDFFHHTDCPDPALFDKILTLLLIHGASFGDKASECFSYATLHGMLEVMKVVLEICQGIDINTRVKEYGGRRKGTPLQLAIGNNRADIVEFLVEIGVKVSQKENKKVKKMLRKR